jgi:hypothetical protein
MRRKDFEFGIVGRVKTTMRDQENLPVARGIG